MSFVGNLFSGDNGLGWKSTAAPLISPLAGNAQGSVNQSQGTIEQQQALATAIAQAGGVQNQQSVYNRLGQVASGQGPNPAAAMLSQATGANVAQNAALMAGQRGASQNAGLIARQAGMQGAAIQQNSAGQAATMQAQQQLAALGQQGGIAGNQVANQMAAQNSLTNAAQTQAGQLIGANVAQNTANIQNVQQQNAANAAIQGNIAQGQTGMFGELTGNVGSVTSALAHGGVVRRRYDDGGIADYGEGGVQASQVSAAQKPSGSGGNALGSIMSLAALLNQGGVARNSYATGGITDFGATSGYTPSPLSSFGMSLQKKQSGLNGGQVIGGFKKLFSSSGAADTSSDNADVTPGSEESDYTSLPDTPGNLPYSYANLPDASGPNDEPTFANGGKVPAMVSPGEKIIPASKVPEVTKGQESPLKAGATVHGKAKVPGDSLKNDVVPKDLAEGSIVLPRSVTQSAHPGPAARRFVEALMKKEKKKVPA